MTDPVPAFLDADHLDETLKRLDELIDRTQDVERLRSGLGMRLALAMAKELRDGKTLGAETTALVAGWTERHGEDSVNAAVAIAREFLTRPDTLAKEFAQRLRQSPPAPAPDAEHDGSGDGSKDSSSPGAPGAA